MSRLAAARTSLASGAALALALAGCLSGPQPSGGGDAGASDAGTDGMTDAGDPFPGARSIHLRDIQAQDLNGDGIDDLILVNEVQSVGDRGVFVLHGPQRRPDDLRYHQFANTVAIPYHVSFIDVVGGPELDLLVLGKRDALDDAVIEIYEQRADGTFEAPSFRQADGFRPDPLLPIMIEVGALTGALRNDVIVADINQLFVYLVDDANPDIVSALAATNPTEIFRDGTGGSQIFDDSINGVLARRLDSGTDDIVVIENRTITWLRNDDAGVFVAEPSVTGALFPIRTFEEIDLGGEPPLDIVGGGLNNFGAWFIEPSAPTVSLESAAWDASVDVELTDIAAGDLEGNASPEVVIFEPVAAGSGELLIFLDARRNGSSMNPATPITRAVPINPDRGQILNFDGAGRDEIWLFDRESGAALCIEFVAGAPTDC